jgi:hypothetical protein
MRVHELANELGIECKQVIELLGGEPKAMSALDDETVAAVREALGNSDEGEAGASQQVPQAKEVTEAPSVEAAEQGPKIVRFWSEVGKHAFAVAGQLVRFEDYLLDVYVSDPGTGEQGVGYTALKALIAVDPDIRIVVDEPFKDVGARKNFRLLLEDKVYTGPNREASAQRGMGFLEALFQRSEHEEVAKTLQEHGVAGLIELAVTTKSYKDTL